MRKQHRFTYRVLDIFGDYNSTGHVDHEFQLIGNVFSGLRSLLSHSYRRRVAKDSSCIQGYT